MKSLSLFPLLFVYAHLFGQTSTNDYARLITNIIQYRNELIGGNFDSYKKIAQLDTLWKLDGHHKEGVDNFLGNVIQAHGVYGLRPEKIIKKWEKQGLPLLHLLSVENIQTILENKHLIDLLTDRILKQDPPFQIDSKTYLFEELDFYKIKDGMRVAEIGAGKGTFSLILGMAYDSLDIYINDKDFFSVEYAKEKITTCQNKNNANEFFFIKGKNKTTRLENIKLDKVLIRNSFHHFSHQPEMLASIRQSLLPDGDLYIADPFLNPFSPFSCKKVMQLDDIKNTVLENGFEIKEEKYNYGWKWIYLHCKPKG